MPASPELAPPALILAPLKEPVRIKILQMHDGIGEHPFPAQRTLVNSAVEGEIQHRFVQMAADERHTDANQVLLPQLILLHRWAALPAVGTPRNLGGAEFV